MGYFCGACKVFFKANLLYCVASISGLGFGQHMRKIYLLCTLAIFSTAGMKTFAQDFSNKGKDFWVAYGYHQVMVGNNAQDMVLYFAAEQTASVTVEIPGLGYAATYTVPAGTVVASNPMPKAGATDARLLAESVAPENKGIHITSDKPVVAYAHIYNSSVSGASILYPTNTLGKEYYSVNFKNTSNSNSANCWFYVVAADPGTTTVEITPSQATINHAAGVTFQVTLSQGQVYNVMGQFTNGGATPSGVDLTGSLIKSVSGPGGQCKRIAVYSGSGRIAISCNASAPSSDNYMSQAVPKAAWGKKYLTTPIVGYNVNNGNTTSATMSTYYRVCVSDPTTVVTINGVPTALPLLGNFYYEIPATQAPQLIEANNPILVAQYFPSQGGSGCPGGTSGDGDPEVIYLSPVEQSINKVLWNASARFQINTTKHYINVVIPNTGTAISSFKLDGVAVAPGSFVVHPQDANYSYARINVSSVTGSPTANTGVSHEVTSDSSFNAIAYGYGGAESYGYNAGTNIKDIYQYVTVQNQYATVNFPATCKSTPFYFSMTFPYQPTQIQWIFGPTLNAMGIADVTLGPPPPTPTGTVIVNGKTLYIYTLPLPYTINTAGTYPIKVIATNPTPDGCGGEQEIDYDLQVFDPPVADFNFTNNGCVTDIVTFTDNSTTGGRPVINRYWDFGDLSYSAINNPTHLYAAPNTYNVRYALITDVGCLSDTITHPVTVTDPPTANFSTAAPYCVGTAVPFTDLSTVPGVSPITLWTWNFGDPASGVNNTSAIQNPTHIFSAPGTYTVTLKVQTTSGCQSQVYSTTVTIRNTPVTDFSLPNVCLPAGNAQFNDLSTIPGAGESITTWSWDFGDLGVSATQNPLHIYAAAGPFTVTLTTTSSFGCTNTKVKQLTTVYAEPQAVFSSAPETCMGNAVNFTDASLAAGSTVNGWSWNFGDPASGVNNTSTLQNPSHNFSAPGTYTVTLNVTSAAGCATVTNIATHQIIVRAMPTASVSGTVSVCLNAPSPSVTFTGAVGLPPYTFTYNINGGSPLTVTTTVGNSVTVSAPTTTAGVYNYNLVSVQDGSASLCSQPQSGTSTVTVTPLPTASITGNSLTCQNGITPVITFTGANGVAPYTFTYDINGGLPQTVSTTVGNTVTINAPTGVPGTFVYHLTGVQESSANLCSQTSLTQSVSITVNPLATASISGTTEVCLNAPSPTVTFTGANGTAPYTFTYNINGGSFQTITTVSGNSITIPVPTNVAGTFSYNLFSVSYVSTLMCTQLQTGSAVVTVNPLPTVNFSATAPTCETRVINFNDLSAANAGVLNTWAWNFGDPASGANNTSALQNPTHTFAAPGTYSVSLQVTTDKGCTKSFTDPNVVISRLPAPGFILPEVCLSDTYAQFTDTSKVIGGTITGWAWNFGDPGSGANNVSALQNPQHSYTATGNYIVSLTVTTNNGCASTLGVPFVVNGDIPVADFTPLSPASYCANDSVSIQDASTVNFGSVTKVEIYWDNVGAPGVFDTDDFPAAGRVYKHLYPNFQAPLTRNFTIRYRAYSGGTCVSDKFRTITVNAAPKVQFLPVPDLCADAAPYQLIQATETGAVPGTVFFTGPGVNATGLFTPSAVGPGTYTIKYRYTSTAAGCSDSATQTVRVLEPPVADFSFGSPACEKSALTFSDISSTPAGTLAQWTWNFGDATPPVIRNNPAPFPHTFAYYGNFNVTLTVQTNNGCNSVLKTIPVTINPIPRPNFTLPASVCLPNANVTFANTSSIPDGTEATFSYVWDFGDPPSGTVNSSTGFSPSHTYTGTGPFNINLQVTSGAGCIRDTTIALTTIHPQPLARFTTNKTLVCIGDAIQFTDASNPLDGTITQWNWVLNDGNVRNNPNFSYTYTTPGTYNVDLFIFNSNGCRSTTFTTTVKVNPYPTVDLGPDRFLLEGGQITFDPAVTAINPTYLWTPNQYFLSTNTILNAIVKGVEDITYTLEVTGEAGCKASDQVFIKVLKAPKIPNIFSPNGDGIHDKWIIDYLESYPGCTVEIFNRYGQRIYHSVGYDKPWDGIINGSPAPVGTYYYIVDPKNGRKIMSGYVDVIR